MTIILNIKFVVFENLNKNVIYSMNFDTINNDPLHPCVYLLYETDQV